LAPAISLRPAFVRNQHAGGLPSPKPVPTEDDGCLYVEAGNQRTLVAWEDGMGFEDGTLLDASGSSIARIGEVIHGGGGYFGSRRHLEELSDESIPKGCMPSGENGDRYAIIYEVEAGPIA
jgi:hypothetical protein